MRVTAIGLIGLLMLTGLLGPLPTSAQRPEKIPRIGVLALGAVDSPVCNRTDPLWEAFQQGLRDLGYMEGQNMRIEYRCGDFQHEQLLALAAELVRLPVDVLVTAGPGALAAKQATTTIPIVFAVLADPLGEGLVASLARPGGNVTGQSLMGTDLVAKRLELLTELVPGLRRLAVLWNAGRPRFASQIQEIHTASASRGLSLDVLQVRSRRSSTTPFAPWETRASRALSSSTTRCSTRNAPTSPPWQRSARSRRFMGIGTMRKSAASCPMARTCPRCSAGRRPSWIRS